MKYKIIADTSYKKEQRLKDILSYCLSTIWLSYGQLWAIIDGTVYLSFDQEVTGGLI